MTPNPISSTVPFYNCSVTQLTNCHYGHVGRLNYVVTKVAQWRHSPAPAGVGVLCQFSSQSTVSVDGYLLVLLCIIVWWRFICGFYTFCNDRGKHCWYFIFSLTVFYYFFNVLIFKPECLTNSFIFATHCVGGFVTFIQRWSCDLVITVTMWTGFVVAPILFYFLLFLPLSKFLLIIISI